MKAQFKPKHFQIFDLYVLKKWPVREVARALGVSTAQVYVVKHRVTVSLRRELRALQQKWA